MLPGAAPGVYELMWSSWTPLAVSSPSQQLHGHHVVRADRAGPEFSASFQLDVLCLKSCSVLPKKVFKEGIKITHTMLG